MSTKVWVSIYVRASVWLPVGSDAANDWKLNMPEAAKLAGDALANVDLERLPQIQGAGPYGGDNFVRCTGGTHGDFESGSTHCYGFEARFAVPLKPPAPRTQESETR